MSYCEKCGAQLSEEANFCPKCGNTIGQDNKVDQVKNEHKINKKAIYAFLAIIGVLLLIVFGSIFFFDYSEKRGTILAREKFIADSIAAENEIKEKKEFLETLYKQILRTDSSIDNIVLGQLTDKVKDKLKKIAQEDGMTDGGLATWIFRIDHYYSPISDNSSVKISEQGGNDFLVEITYHYNGGEEGIYKLLLSVIDEGGAYKIDNVKINEAALGAEGEAYAYEEEEKNSAEISSALEEDYYSSTSSSSSHQMPFNDEGDILARIYNQRFRHSSGLEIRIDGYGRIEIGGDPAGVLSVLRYNSESALLRYGNGMYGEGKILLKIDGSKLLLQDPVDGSVFNQR